MRLAAPFTKQEVPVHARFSLTPAAPLDENEASRSGLGGPARRLLSSGHENLHLTGILGSAA